MNEDSLDKIARLVSAIHDKYNIDVSFSYGYYGGVALCNTFYNSLPKQHNHMYEAVEELESLLNTGIVPCKEHILESINKLNKELDMYNSLLGNTEGK